MFYFEYGLILSFEYKQGSSWRKILGRSDFSLQEKWGEVS